MLSINDLKNGSFVVIDGVPYAVLSVKHQHIGRGGSNVQTRIKNLRTGAVLERNFKPADQFEEADIVKAKAKFIYSHRGEFWFNDEAGRRFSLQSEVLGESASYLKPDLELTLLKFNDRIINVELPIKADYKVIEAPPSVKGNTAQGGTKTVVIETGLKVQTPLFIKEGDTIRVNTQTGEYVERVEKA